MDYKKFVEERKQGEKDLLAAIKADMINLQNLLDNLNSEWWLDDHVYRFYHQSFKVFYAQETTLNIVEALKKLLPERELNKRFLKILADGTGREFKMEDNHNWEEATRPILEALFHAKYFLEMAVKHGKELDEPPQLMPTGWAGLLYLYNLR